MPPINDCLATFIAFDEHIFFCDEVSLILFVEQNISLSANHVFVDEGKSPGFVFNDVMNLLTGSQSSFSLSGCCSATQWLLCELVNVFAAQLGFTGRMAYREAQPADVWDDHHERRSGWMNELRSGRGNYLSALGKDRERE